MRVLCLSLAIVVFAVLCASPASGATAKVPSTNVCSFVFNTSLPVISISSCLAPQDSALSVCLTIGSMLSNSTCTTAFMRYCCGVVYPNAVDAASSKGIPKFVCDAVNTNCDANDLTRIGALWNPNLQSNFGAFLSKCYPDNSPTISYLPSPPLTNYLLPRCETYTGQFCKSFVNGPIYVPSFYTQAAVEAQLAPNAYAIIAVSRLGCRDQLMRVLCASAFPPCATPLAALDPRLTAGFPQLPQRSLCTTAASSCLSSGAISAGAYQQLAAAVGFSNCSATRALQNTCSGSTYVPTYSIDSFPVTQTVFSANAIVGAYAGNTVAKADSGLFACPDPLVTPDNPNEPGVLGGSCGAPCPSLLLTREQYKKVDDITYPLAGISLVCQVLLLITYIIFPRARKNMYAVEFTMNVLMICIALFFSVVYDDTPYGRTPSYQCDSNTQVTVMRGYCLFQGIIMVFCPLAAVNLWFIQALDLYLQIQFQARKWSAEKQFRKNVLYHLWAWGWPSLTIIVCLSTKNIGNVAVGIPYCFVLDDGITWGMFYAIVFAQCVFGAVIMSLILWAIYRSSAASGMMSRKGWWKIYIRPLIFVAILELVWLFIFIYRIHSNIHTKEYTDDSVNFVTCLLQTRPAAAAMGINVNCSRANFPINLSQTLIGDVVGVGLWAFVLVVGPEHFYMWRDLLTGRGISGTTTVASQTNNSRKKETTTPRSIFKKPTGAGTSSALSMSERPGNASRVTSGASVGSDEAANTTAPSAPAEAPSPSNAGHVVNAPSQINLLDGGIVDEVEEDQQATQ